MVATYPYPHVRSVPVPLVNRTDIKGVWDKKLPERGMPLLTTLVSYKLASMRIFVSPSVQINSNFTRRPLDVFLNYVRCSSTILQSVLHFQSQEFWFRFLQSVLDTNWPELLIVISVRQIKQIFQSWCRTFDVNSTCVLVLSWTI